MAAKTAKTKNPEPKRLYRSRKEKLVAGVCGGYAEYFEIDPVWVRLLAIISVLFGGLGIFVYVASWILMPKNPVQKASKNTPAEDAANNMIKMTKSERKSSIIVGLVLIILAMLFFFENMFGWFDFRCTWPVILVVVGTYLIFKK